MLIYKDIMKELISHLGNNKEQKQDNYYIFFLILITAILGGVVGVFGENESITEF